MSLRRLHLAGLCLDGPRVGFSSVRGAATAVVTTVARAAVAHGHLWGKPLTEVGLWRVGGGHTGERGGGLGVAVGTGAAGRFFGWACRGWCGVLGRCARV